MSDELILKHWDDMTSAERKQFPIATGAIGYFPDAIAYVAHVSFISTQQHHPGSPMHWDRSKSMDHEDCIARHGLQVGQIDRDKLRHTGKRAWRALAALQIEIEEARKAYRETMAATKADEPRFEPRQRTCPCGNIGSALCVQCDPRT